MGDTILNKTTPNQTQHNFPSFYDITLPLSPNFNLERAVCSHGLFMTSPNKWDPQTRSLLRPLRLSNGATSALTRVSQDHPHALLVRVYGTPGVDPEDEVAVVGQVRRMLRLEEDEERKVREFWEVHVAAREMGFGRVFRSPCLFEDMIKCILFCNCQWPRTLSMAQALCDLQLELVSHSSRTCINAADGIKSKASSGGSSNFVPATPAIKESKSKRKNKKKSVFEKNANAQKSNRIHLVESLETTSVSPSIVSASEDESGGVLDSGNNACLGGEGLFSTHMMGNFPSPEEIAGLDEKYLSKRCGLGYRAGRILKLAQSIVEGRVQLSELEEMSKDSSLLNYDKLNEKLKEIHGFGPFTRDNVLMCMGFYNIVPTDSETIRHLQQVHSRKTTIKTVKEVVDEMYGKYEPFQFLAYWSEIWKFYEDWFGKTSEMPGSEYRLITASNMKINKRKHNHMI